MVGVGHPSNDGYCMTHHTVISRLQTSVQTLLPTPYFPEFQTIVRPSCCFRPSSNYGPVRIQLQPYGTSRTSGSSRAEHCPAIAVYTKEESASRQNVHRTSIQLGKRFRGIHPFMDTTIFPNRYTQGWTEFPELKAKLEPRSIPEKEMYFTLC